MSSLNSDHNHYALNQPRSRKSSQSSAYGSTSQSIDQLTPSSAATIAPLPAHTYTPPAAKRPKTGSREQNVTTAYTNGSSGSRDGSSDPHDFYRQHQDLYRAGLGEETGKRDIRVIEQRGASTVGSESALHPRSTRNNLPKLPPLKQHINSRYTASPTERSPLSGAKSSPSLSSTARHRQTSLKELVNKFNQNPDETLPLPRNSSSRSPSSSSNSGAHSIRARTSSLSNRPGNGLTKSSSPKSSYSKATPRSHIPRGRTNDDSETSPRSRRMRKPQRNDGGYEDRQLTSHSTTYLPSHPQTVARKPLFGEILATSPIQRDLGYGVIGARRRRGSEGSMHSPNPMFPQDRGRQMSDIPPSSPSAWYLGVTRTLEDIKADKAIPDPPANLHRRTRSDFSGASRAPPISSICGSNLSPGRDQPSSPSSTGTSKRNSQSRIPIRSRRLSTASDSGNSAASTRNNSSLGRVYIKSATEASSSLPTRSKHPRNPPQHSGSNTPQRSPRRTDGKPGTHNFPSSPRLAAYISTPMPKKSPPLRSSRPRQTVTNASTSASRARAVERFAVHETETQRSPRERRPRKPPELANVDFAARRDQIQRAVSKSVRDSEIIEERKRASMALDDRHHPALPVPEENEVPEGQDESKNEAIQGQDILEDGSEEKFNTIAEEMPPSERELKINTGHLSERSVLDLSMEDSPTLGSYDRFSSNVRAVQESIPTPPSDVEPSSAITAGTSDSVDTFFDDEPQDESQESSRRPSREHQTLLNHIMTMRDTSPSPERVRRPSTLEESASEKDDRESIQIMLGETPVLEKAPLDDGYEIKPNDLQSSEGPESRWSMSSWTSSTRSRDERDAPMERIDEHSPLHPEQPAHLSISTSASQQTPQPWSPASFTSHRTGRTTLDSDAYSTINRVLDHYHDPSLVSPEIMHDVQQHIFTQSPDLARRGGYDPKKVTQLYLQELARSRHSHSNSLPDALKIKARQRTGSGGALEVSDKEVRDDLEEKMVESVENENKDLTLPTANLGADGGDTKLARASLNHPDDWDMSPSLGGLELQAEAVDSPTDERPTLPPKDWKISKNDSAGTPDRGENQVRAKNSRPQLPPIEGLGLAINIMPPQKNDSPTIPPPPLPFYSAPPPPVEPSLPAGVRSPPSPSVYSKHVASSIYPARPPSIEAPVPPLPSNESSHQSRSAVSSIRPSISSSASQDRPSVDGPSFTTESTSKHSSPSPDQKRLTRRRHIIKELVDTEHSFGQDMKVIDDIYKETSLSIISGEDVKILFGNSNQIATFSTNFLDALKQGSKPVYILAKAKRWKSNRVSNSTSYSGNTDDQSSINGIELSDEEKDRKTFIGESFGHHMTDMEQVYAEYLKNHDAANQKLQALQKNSKVQIWLKECRAYAHDLTTAWDLDSLLVKPVQRILKYPLLLGQLLEVTPENHPDFTALDIAARGMKGMSMRINEMKKHADIVEQMTNSRKRKESDVRIGLSKAFGRRTEKLRQQVGLSDIVEDKAYSAVSEKFGSHFFQLQVVMRDVEMYTVDVQKFMNRFCDFVVAIEAHIDVSQTNYPETESKWRRFRTTTREMSMTALTDHVSAVRKHVIEPMTTLLKLHDGPQKLMQKRNKRVIDYARFKAIKDRGDKPDKKTIEQGEQFQAVNETLKHELPRLFALTGRLVEACLHNFVQLQVQWQIIWKRKLSQAIDDKKVPESVQAVIEAFTGDFPFYEAQVLSLGICNGALLGDAANQVSFLSPTTTLNSDDPHGQRHASSLDLSKRRTLSVSSDKSPVLPQPDFVGRTSGSFFSVGDGVQLAPGGAPTGHYVEPARRMRASSTLSGHSPRTPEVPGSYHSFSNSTTPVNPTPPRPYITTPRNNTAPSPPVSRPSIETPSSHRPSEESARGGQLPGSTYLPNGTDSQGRSSSPYQRFSGFFSSAMPMSDSPRAQSPATSQVQQEFNVIWLAASVYEFNIDRARKEAGYPYLTYVSGEIFDVIGEKGELWLAKNQDDKDNLIGWIWNKHFVKLAS